MFIEHQWHMNEQGIFLSPQWADSSEAEFSQVNDDKQVTFVICTLSVHHN